MGWLARLVIALAVAAGALGVGTAEALAHQDGCHRWHSCPSDTGSYVCGDLGYYTYCGYDPTTTTPPPATTDLYDCSDFTSQQSAQTIFNLYADDRYGLDADADRLACEELPCPCTPALTPPPPPPRPVAEQDATPPQADVFAADVQRVLRQGGLRFAIECDEDCVVGLAGSVLIGRRVYRLVSDSASLVGGERTQFVLRLPARTRSALRNALRSGRRVRVHLAVAASDLEDNDADTASYIFRVKA